MSPIETAIFLVVCVERFQAAFITPIWEKLNWDKFFLMYVAWALGGALVFVSQVNLFSAYLPPEQALLGRILSALVAGGGANLLHDQFDKKTPLAPYPGP